MHYWKTNDAKLRKMIGGNETQVENQESMLTYAKTQLGTVGQKDERVLGTI